MGVYVFFSNDTSTYLSYYYTEVIEDYYGDGICQDNNRGYNLTVDGIVISSSYDDYYGNFGSRESQIFGCLPSTNPSSNPSFVPSYSPSSSPSVQPSLEPTIYPTVNPSETPSIIPSHSPSDLPSKHPSFEPTLYPTINPSSNPTDRPSKIPSFHPTITPSFLPTSDPVMRPSLFPTLHSRLNDKVNGEKGALSKSNVVVEGSSMSTATNKCWHKRVLLTVFILTTLLL